MTKKAKYFFDSAKKRLMGRGRNCPSCGSNRSHTVDSKYWVSRLARCGDCELLFRAPTSSSDEQSRYYQEAYQQGFTTDCPDEEALRDHKEKRFAGTGKSFAERIDVLNAVLGESRGRLLDYGCSWGYGTWQLQEAGWQTVGFEISKPRCAYARDKMRIDARDDIEDIDGKFDVFFSSHVLEHVPSVASVIQYAFHVLKPGGLFISYTPNGSDEFRERDYGSWHRLWGLDHPNFLDEKFFKRNLVTKDYLITSTPVGHQEVGEWALDGGQVVRDLPGSELLVLAKK